MKQNPLVYVPSAWVDAMTDWYLNGPYKTTLYAPISSFPYQTKRLKAGLAAVYGPDGLIPFEVKRSAGPGAAGATAYPDADGVIKLGYMPDMSPGYARSVVRHELRHAVQHLGDLALRATMTAGEKQAVAKRAKKYGKPAASVKMRGRFGRPSPKTTARLRTVIHPKTKAGKILLSKVGGKYQHQPSEYHPHVGSAADGFVAKLSGNETAQEFNDKLRAYTQKSSARLARIPGTPRIEAIKQFYGEVMRLIEDQAAAQDAPAGME